MHSADNPFHLSSWTSRSGAVVPEVARHTISVPSRSPMAAPVAPVMYCTRSARRFRMLSSSDLEVALSLGQLFTGWLTPLPPPLDLSCSKSALNVSAVVGEFFTVGYRSIALISGRLALLPRYACRFPSSKGG